MKRETHLVLGVILIRVGIGGIIRGRLVGVEAMSIQEDGDVGKT